MDLQEITVLVVEDNVSNFVLIARLLGYLGIHCEWKTSGYEVVEYADLLPKLDLILMDIRLPYEDGYEALKKIRSSPRLTSIPVIAITAEAWNKCRKHTPLVLMASSVSQLTPIVSPPKFNKS